MKTLCLHSLLEIVAGAKIRDGYSLLSNTWNLQLRASEHICVSCLQHNDAWPNGQEGAGIQPFALLAKPCSSGFNLHKGILGTRNGMANNGPATSYLNRTGNVNSP